MIGDQALTARRFTIPVIALVSCMVLACGAPTGRQVRGEAAPVIVNETDDADAVAALNAFALDLGSTLTAMEGNVALAAYPIARGLAMARAGARNETRAALDRVLRVGQTADFDVELAAVEQSLVEREGERRNATRKGPISMAMPSVLWAQEETRFMPEFLDALSAYYDVGVRVVDFRSDPDEARHAINRWASNETQGSVELLVPRGGVTDFTRFVAASAGSVKAPWAVRFDPDETARDPFTRLDGQTIPTTSMTVRDSGSIRSATTVDWDAVELPYLGGELAMLLVVPAPGRFGDVAAAFDIEAFRTVTGALAPRPVELRMPRFEFSSVVNLDEELSSLGLSDLFANERADFAGVTDDEALDLSDVVHGTYAAADEEGTDGEAVTVVRPNLATPVGVTHIDIDRPFLFLVRDRVSGLILQFGRVLEPQG